MKINKSNFGWIFACCTLTLLLGISIYLGVTGWFINTDMTYTTDLELGKTIQIDVDKNMSNAASLNLDGSFLEGQSLPQTISIKGLQDEGGLYLRAKVFVYTSDNETKKIDIVQTVNWQYDEVDGYYYFTDLLSPNDKVALCSHLLITEGTNLNTGKKYIVTFVVEAIDEGVNVVSVWGKNPLENIWL